MSLDHNRLSTCISWIKSMSVLQQHLLYPVTTIDNSVRIDQGKAPNTGSRWQLLSYSRDLFFHWKDRYIKSSKKKKYIPYMTFIDFTLQKYYILIVLQKKKKKTEWDKTSGNSVTQKLSSLTVGAQSVQSFPCTYTVLKYIITLSMLI